MRLGYSFLLGINHFSPPYQTAEMYSEVVEGPGGSTQQSVLLPNFSWIVSLIPGPKTVFFWAPMFKWGLVMAGLADMSRPAEKLSLSQSCVLTATGLVWSRYSLVIIPKNWNLFAVNLFVGSAGISQLYRIFRYEQQKKADAKEQAITPVES
uniref:Mitochondrial pyruvate carrier n=1 Tax=Esox lucius TaxID=8010 RepID=A0AAY5L3Q7_ESOLU